MVILAIGAEVVVWALLSWGLTWVVQRRVRSAEATPSGSTAWKVGAMVAVPFLIFWEWLPTWIAYEQYSRQAGFTVHKALEQWRIENPGVAEGLERFALPNDPRGQTKPIGPSKFRKLLNQRIAYDTDRRDVFPNIQIWTYEVVDVAAAATLARHVKVMAGNHGGLASGGPGWWKFWTIHGPQSRGDSDFSKFLERAADLGSVK